MKPSAMAVDAAAGNAAKHSYGTLRNEGMPASCYQADIFYEDAIFIA